MGDRQRFLHIIESIAEMEKYTANAHFTDFQNNSMMKFACIKQLEIIGEAANYLSENLKNKFPAIQWRQIIGLRHILVHENFGIDDTLIWQIISKDIPVLKSGMKSCLDYLDLE